MGTGLVVYGSQTTRPVPVVTPMCRIILISRRRLKSPLQITGDKLFSPQISVEANSFAGIMSHFPYITR